MFSGSAYVIDGKFIIAHHESQPICCVSMK